ncbi:MAG: aminoacetone oxidase family FAD-binding enzyme [Capsulimonas sp.]|uniref:NAD(P)/FAD-dependent oxidoreductase n=1 Tax=Capsulimonas sp. TaxID=2494211 RepID=UPI003265C643
MSKAPEVLIVGGGAAGIIAARRAADSGARVTLLEKNERLGMKILISGGGKCNLTHAGSMEEIRRQFRPNEGRFLKPSFYKFTNNQFLEILHARGLRSYVRPDGRIFPVDPANAKDVVALLTQYVEEAGVRIRYKAPAAGIDVTDGAVQGVRLEDGSTLRASRVIVCTGGSSFPATGTTGDGWRWLSDIGHTIVPLRAALAPMYLADAHVDWSGVALRDIVLRARAGREGKEIGHWPGDLLFTHKGVSGPTALGVSREVAERDAGAVTPPSTLEADTIPTRSYEDLHAAFRKELTDNPRRTAASLVAPYVPSRLVDPLLAAAGVAGDTRGSQFPAKALKKLVSTLKGWPLGDVRHVPLERGEVVAGGVSLDEVDPQTMHSKIVSGLYLCGEVLDIAGPVGGYNLQAAWSTGYVAGDSAAS